MSSAIHTQDQIDEANAGTEQNLIKAGLATHDQIQVEDYWGYDFSDKYVFPDGKQFIEFKRMTEGDKVEFQRKTNRKVRVARTTGDAEMNVDPAGDRKTLIQISVTGWYMFRKDHRGDLVEVAFSERTLSDWLVNTNPLYVEKLEKAIRDANPWMKQEMTVEAIDAELANLQEQRAQAVERERGE